MAKRNDRTLSLPGNGRFSLSSEASVQRRRVLVVEDHDDTRSMLKTILEMQDFSVLEAVDGKAAFDLAVGERPDLILMDLTLPIVDGVTATRTIRKHKVVGKVPIIFLSGRAEPARRRAALDAGCNDYLIKPIDIDEMLSVMQRWLPAVTRAGGPAGCGERIR